MKTRRFHQLALATAMALTAIVPKLAVAQEFGEASQGQPAAADESWYSTPAPRAEKPTVAREKAMQRGQERMARLNAMRWYGYSNSRPTAATMPFTSMYSPAWQQPGGRPFAWYTSSRPVVIYHSTPSVVR